MAENNFDAILEEMRLLRTKKGADYGKDEDSYANVKAAEEWGVAPWIGCLIRATDKVRRLQKAAKGGTLVNESIEDSLLDAAVYFVIALDLFRQEQAEQNSRTVEVFQKEFQNTVNEILEETCGKIIAVDIDDTEGVGDPLRIAISDLTKEIVPGSALDSDDVREALARRRVGCYRLDVRKENVPCPCVICEAEKLLRV